MVFKNKKSCKNDLNHDIDTYRALQLSIPVHFQQGLGLFIVRLLYSLYVKYSLATDNDYDTTLNLP